MRYLFLLLSLAPVSASAQYLIKSPTPGAGQNLCDFIMLLFTIATWIGMPIIGVMIITFGYKIATANGDMAIVKKSRSAIIWALVGLAIILSAKTILQITINTGQSISDGGPLQSICPL